jgi:hypothetical protein
MESRHLQGCSARLCRLRTNELVLTSKYWTYRSHAGVYGSSKPSSLSTTEAWLKLTASLVNSGEKLGTDPRSVSQRAVDYVGSPFSREQWDPSKFVGDLWKIVIHLLCEIRMVWDHTQTERGMRVSCWSGFFLQVVHRFESPQLSNISNRLPRGSLHVVN